ncbi:MAG: class I SAM-dependent methyltransferase [Pseudomonadales bacterium]|nr:class I SAM-dependent methyltransferase [Pseudomonadales bacterium]
MGLYNKYILPRIINTAMKSREMEKIRRQLIPMASGKVIEAGIGSGLNLPFYNSETEVLGIDPSEELQEYAREVARETGTRVEFLAQTSEEIPVPDNEFDTAVVTWSLCTIPEPERTLAELRRVLKPGGQLIFAEHGRSPEPGVSRWQDRINPVWRVIGGGCNLNREPGALIEQAGFQFTDKSEGYIPGPKFATWTVRGRAIAP